MVPDLATFGNPVPTLALSGLVYQLRSSIGEQIFAQQAGNVILASGPPGAPGSPGPPGPPGTVSYYNFTLPTTTSGASGTITLGSVTVPAGTYLIFGQCYFQGSSGDSLTDCEAWIQDSSNNVWANGSFTWQVTGTVQGLEYIGLPFFGIVTLASGDTLTMQASASDSSGGTNWTIGGTDLLSFPATNFTALKVA